MEPADVIAQRIQVAFADVARPHISEIVPHQCAECDALRDSLSGITCDALTGELLHKHVWDLPLLSAKAKHYFLPAWLCAALADPTGDAADAARINIDSNQGYDPESGYSNEQWLAVISWLDYLATTSEVVMRELAHAAKIALQERL
nr:hypothetical protein [uncultured Roseateles sp.]